jgi:hypothetical protein
VNLNVATKDGKGKNLTCGERSEGEPRVLKHAVSGYAGESGKAPGRLRIDLVEALLCNVARVGKTMPFRKTDCRKNIIWRRENRFLLLSAKAMSWPAKQSCSLLAE